MADLLTTAAKGHKRSAAAAERVLNALSAIGISSANIPSTNNGNCAPVDSGATSHNINPRDKRSASPFKCDTAARKCANAGSPASDSRDEPAIDIASNPTRRLHKPYVLKWKLTEQDATESFNRWMDTTFVENANSYLASRLLVISARNFFVGLSPLLAYVDEREVLNCILEHFPASGLEYASALGKIWRVVTGIGWAKENQSRYKKLTRPAQVPDIPLQVIISAAPQTHELLPPHRVFENNKYDSLPRPCQHGVHSILYAWVREVFIVDPENYAVDQDAAIEAYKTAFCDPQNQVIRGIDNRKFCMKPGQFKAALLAIYPMVQAKTLGDGDGAREVFYGLRWGGIVGGKERSSSSDPDDFTVQIHPGNHGLGGSNLTSKCNNVESWLRSVLVYDKNLESAIDIVDIYLAYRAIAEPGRKLDPKFGPMNMLFSIKRAIPTAADISLTDSQNNAIIGMRWKALEDISWSFAASFSPFPPEIRSAAHHLLYLPQRKRVHALIRMYFQPKKRCSVALSSLYRMYELAFWRPQDTHPLVHKDDFEKIIRQQFKDSTVVEVSPGHSVFLGLTPREKPRSPKKQLAIMRSKALEKLEKSGEITRPKQRTVFSQHLFNDPLLSLPRVTCMTVKRVRELYGERIETNVSETAPANVLTPGPFIDRLYRRGYQGQGGRQPLGDEEPGFPGISMKHRQARIVATYQNFLEKGMDPQLSEVERRYALDLWMAAAHNMLDCEECASATSARRGNKTEQKVAQNGRQA